MKFRGITGIKCEIAMFIRTMLMLINQWIWMLALVTCWEWSRRPDPSELVIWRGRLGVGLSNGWTSERCPRFRQIRSTHFLVRYRIVGIVSPHTVRFIGVILGVSNWKLVPEVQWKLDVFFCLDTLKNERMIRMVNIKKSCLLFWEWNALPI